MKVLVLQQVAIEGSGWFGAFMRRQRISYHVIRLYRGDSIPLLIRYDALLVLGGPMNVYEEDRYPFLREENKAIQWAVEKGIPYLGICLGAQLLAKALGAPVMANRVKEIGFQDVQLSAVGEEDRIFRGLPATLPVFQWHGDTFALPPGAIGLATSETCDHQAFRYGHHAYGLQFHLEVTAAMVRRWARDYAAELEGMEPGVRAALLPPDLARRTQEMRLRAETLFTNFLGAPSSS